MPLGIRCFFIFYNLYYKYWHCCCYYMWI